MAFGDISRKMSSGNGWLVWGTGYKESYCTGGSFENAKEMAIRILQTEEYVYMPCSGRPEKWIWAAGFHVSPVKVSEAIRLLRNTSKGYFEEFQLTDCTTYKQNQKIPMAPSERESTTHLVLEISDMKGCTDHCFD